MANKYNAKRTVCNQGHAHPSAKEARHCDDLHEYLEYCSITGVLKWKKKLADKIVVGNEAGSLHSGGYRSLKFKGVNYLTHRLIWFMVNGEFPDIIDHANGCKTDNRIVNLRAATKSQNAFNSKLQKRSKSGFKGVNFHRNRWYAHTKLNGKKIHIGCFDTAEEAHKAYLEKVNLIAGEFANAG